ncbi:MAG: hypothetical protein KGZ65_06750 [Sphingomonadales bacterium]|nr:hypothetical protein [Sphingomonadaceae bacterium]MBS3930917.1 hypothetical protein [Sphingomonadales bacterium]
MAFSVQWLVDGPNTSRIEQSGRIVSKYKRTYLYKTDAASPPTDAQITTDVGIAPGSPHPDDANATCQSVEISHGVGPTKCPHFARHVVVEWATNAPVPNTVSTDPTTMRTRWSLAPTIQQRYIVRDRNGAMIVNAAGQPFDGGIPVAVRLGTAVARRNVTAAGYNQNTVLANSGKLNSTTFLGGAAGTIQVDISAEEKYDGGYHYWEEVYTFAYDPLGWQPKPMNAGFFQKGTYGLTRIINSDLDDTNDPLAPVQEPEPLLPDGTLVPVDDRPGLCNFITVDAYGSMDFSTFGL